MNKKIIIFVLLLGGSFFINAGKHESKKGKSEARACCRVKDCGKSFALESHARRHLRSHQDYIGLDVSDTKYLDKYKCKYCNVRFLDKRKIDAHSHKTCLSCGICFSNKSSLSSHKRECEILKGKGSEVVEEMPGVSEDFLAASAAFYSSRLSVRDLFGGVVVIEGRAGESSIVRFGSLSEYLDDQFAREVVGDSEHSPFLWPK